MAEEDWQLLYKSRKLTRHRNIESGNEVYTYLFYSVEEKDQFRESRKGAASLQHANISPICILDSYSQGLLHSFQLGIELCQVTLEDETASRLSESRTWSAQEVIGILRDVLAALQYAATQVAVP